MGVGAFVVVRGGCTPIERLKTEIYDRESRLQWYMVKGGVLRDFLKVGKLVKLLILILNKGVLW